MYVKKTLKLATGINTQRCSLNNRPELSIRIRYCSNIRSRTGYYGWNIQTGTIRRNFSRQWCDPYSAKLLHWDLVKT